MTIWSDRTKTAPNVSASPSEVANTTDDMSNLAKWKYGDEIYGTYAKSSKGLYGYVKDIKKAYGKEDSYRNFFVDTLSSKSVSDQLKER